MSMAGEIDAILAQAYLSDASAKTQEQAEKIRNLEKMLELANDKMAEQVRQARWEVADEAIQTVAGSDIWVWLTRLRDDNAPKD